MFRFIVRTLRNTCCRAVIVKKINNVPEHFQKNRPHWLSKETDSRPSHIIVFRFDRKTLLSKICKPLTITMDSPIRKVLQPPVRVKGMTTLDRKLFDDLISVQSLTVPTAKLPITLKYLKKYQLKLRHIKPVVDLEKSDGRFKSHRLVLLDPNVVCTHEDIPANIREKLMAEEIPVTDLQTFDIRLTYENWNFQEILRAILPDDSDGLSGFTEVGHIAHFNLRDSALPYKKVIGEVLLDKLPTVKTVVNKLNSIDNTYRTFQMELLAGEENYVTQTRENGCTYELDFSKVYWNSRLGTEHGRISQNLKSTDVVFDVFAGIGPFAVPAARRHATVFANDLNPHSYEALVKNVQLNKCKGNIKCFNLDGREFIETCVKDKLSKIYSASNEVNQSECWDLEISKVNITDVVILMNLPALAVTFLDAFSSLLSDLEDVSGNIPLPKVHCYCFTDIEEANSKWDGEMTVEVKHRTIGIIGGLLLNDIDVRHVRNVSPQKDMVCVNFRLTKDILLGRHVTQQLERDQVEPPVKLAKLDVATG